MDLECAICCSLLIEEPDVEGPPLPPKRSRETAEPVAGPSSESLAPPSPELCVPLCGHMFHKKCLIDWIRISKYKTCPSCRKALIECQLVTVFLPVVDKEEKKCENCVTAGRTLEELTVEKEQFKKLYEGEEERRKGAEMEVKKGVELMDNRVNQVKKEKLEIVWKLYRETIKNRNLTAEKEQFKKRLEEEEERRKGVEMEAKREEEINIMRVRKEKKKRRRMASKLLEEERKVEELTDEKEHLKKQLKKERRRGKEMEGKKMREGHDNRARKLIKEKVELERKFLEEERKVGGLQQKVVEKQGTLNELQERHRLLICDVEEMTKRYEVEQEKANILEGRVASLEAQLQQDQSQSEDSMVDHTSDSDADE